MRKKRLVKRDAGFTLIELSIVIVIIGVLVGGIFSVQALVRASELRRALAEYDSYVKAIHEFQEKFYALPGDIKEAESIWGADSNCPNTASNTVPKEATCNGDGNGSIGSSTTGAAFSNTYEWFRAWQHMANAGFIQSRFTGVAGSGGATHSLVGVNVPASGLSGAGWTLNFMLLTSDGSLWGDQYGHLLHLGSPTASGYTTNPAVTTEEAFSMDQKIDDGKPGRGKLRAWRTSVLANCTQNDTTQDAQSYNISYNSDKACALVFLLGF